MHVPQLSLAVILQPAAGQLQSMPAPELSLAACQAGESRSPANDCGCCCPGIVFRAGVQVFEGQGRVVDPHTVMVDGRKCTVRFLRGPPTAAAGTCSSCECLLNHIL